jgi:SPP1 gp7 family putative phage head morphogenesis protein
MGDGLVGWFDLSSLTASQSRRFTQVGLVEARKAGIIDDDEARAEIGYEPRDTAATEDPEPEPVDGQLLVQRAQAFNLLVQSLTPASAALLTGLDVTAVEPKPEPEPAPAPAEAAPATLSDEDLAEIRQILSAEHRDPDTDDRAAIAEARRAATWVEADARATLLEHTMTRQMQKLFTRQETSTLTRLQGKRGRQLIRDLADQADTRAPSDLPDPGDLFDPAFWTGETIDAATPVYEQSVAAGGRAIAAKFGVVFDLAQPYVQEFILARANNLAGHVTDTTYRAIQQALADGVAQGWSIEELATAIRSVFSTASQQRAEMIARTEVLSAYNGAQALEAALLPEDVVAGKEWVSVRDERVRDAHGEADGQTVAVADPFSVEAEELLYPGDPNGSPDNIINCRCTLAYLTPDEMPQQAERAPQREARDIEDRLAFALFRAVAPEMAA